MEMNPERNFAKISRQMYKDCQDVIQSIAKLSKSFETLSEQFTQNMIKEKEFNNVFSKEEDGNVQKKRRYKKKKKELLGVKQKRSNHASIQGRLLKIQCVDQGVKTTGYKIQIMINDIKTVLGPFLYINKVRELKAKLITRLKACPSDTLDSEEKIKKTFNNLKDEIYEENPPAKTEKSMKRLEAGNKMEKYNRAIEGLNDEDDNEEKDVDN